MTKQESVLQELKEFEKGAKAEQGAARALRKEAVGLLTPALLRDHLRTGTELVLAYGRKGHTVTFTVDDLKRFVAASERTQRGFRTEVRGVPLVQLEKTSDPKDVMRSKGVRTATLYRVERNLLHFRVTGNSKAHYRVRVRLEEWDQALHAVRTNAHVMARTVAMGRISIDCECGRHQYWYRYLTNIGGFDVSPPKEKDFPKIRNPGLKGCCCKHVLKVLRVLKSSTIHAFLAKEIDLQSASKGFADTVRSRLLNKEEVKQVSVARGVSKNTKEGRDAYRQFLRDAQDYMRGAEKKKAVREQQDKLKPRRKPAKMSPAAESLTVAMRQRVVKELQDLSEFVKLGRKSRLSTETIGDALKRKSEQYKKLGLSVNDLKVIMKEEGIA